MLNSIYRFRNFEIKNYMIFLSVQPDSINYIWQLDVLIFNLINLGLPSKNIQVLFGFDVERGLNPVIEDFIKRHPDISIYSYPDTRTSKKYASSLRPHIMAKHFEAFPDMETETFFYHDADLLFRELPDLDFLAKGDTWYVADTKNYLGYNYLKSRLSQAQLVEMCSIVGISKDKIIENDAEVGGAQYVLKNTTI